MKTKSLLYCLSLLLIISCSGTTNKNDYLEKVLSQLEQIESATYYTTNEVYQPGDTTALFVSRHFIQEYDNPKDSTIGAAYASFGDTDPTKMDFGYDGQIRMMVNHEKQRVTIDDFTYRPLPFRPLTPPFFNYTKNIIHYALTTEDSIHVDLQESIDHYRFKLIIHEDKQVEFFGKAYHMPENPYTSVDHTSSYEIWISKTENRPYKVRREMSHETTVTTCSDVKINTLSIHDFQLSDYIPEDYTVRSYGDKDEPVTVQNLTGKKAPDWTLYDMNDHTVGLKDLKSKVLLLNLTGIGCGACHASIPFLKELKETYNTDDFELISIETWMRKPRSLRVYADKQKINYPFLCGTDEVVRAYQTGGAAPYFFILDEQRIIRKVIFGYSDNLAGEIKKSITELL